MKKIEFIYLLISVTSVISCGGGGGGTNGSSNSAVFGVAAVGAPLINSTINLKDSNGNTASTSTDSINGSYQIDTTNLTPPFILRAQKPNGDFLYSASFSNGISNINPLSNVIIGGLSQTIGTGADPNALYQAFTAYSNKVTKVQIDTSTATIYNNLTPAFKAQLGGADINPIYATYNVGSTLDKAFDSTNLVYDITSGQMQELSLAGTSFSTFGSLGNLNSIKDIAGNFSGNVQIGSNLLPIFLNIDTSGNITLYINGQYTFFGVVNISGSLANGSGVIYLLNNGLSSYSQSNSINSTISIGISNNNLLINFGSSIGDFPATLTLQPNVNLTSGNTFVGSQKSFQYKKFGPFVITDGSNNNGTSSYNTTSYLVNALPVNCYVQYIWGIKLADLSQSLYQISLQENYSTSYTQNVPIPLSTAQINLIYSNAAASKASITSQYLNSGFNPYQPPTNGGSVGLLHWQTVNSQYQAALSAVDSQTAILLRQNNGYTQQSCPLAGTSNAVQGGAVIINSGLLTVSVDTASANNTNEQYNIVSAQILNPQ